MLRVADSSIRSVRSSLLLAGLLAATVLSACSDATDPMPTRVLAPTQPAGYIALAGVLTITPDTLDFGSVLLGGETAPKSFTISNTGNAPLELWELAAASPGDFVVVPSNGECAIGRVIQPGAQCTTTWNFKPIAEGARSGSLRISADATTRDVQFVGTSYSDADVAVSMTANPTTAQVSKTLTYAITITDNGPGKATGIRLTDVLPPMTTFASISASIKTSPCITPAVGSTGTVSCDLSWMPAGSTFTYQLTVNVASGGHYSSIDNTAKVSTTSADKVTSNNSATIAVSLRGKK